MSIHGFVNRPEREITDQSALTGLLQHGRFAVLALCRANEPYIVTLSYGYDQADHSLYFHGAGQGLKFDFIKSNPMVCGTIIDDGGYIAGECAQVFKSLVFRGRINIVEEPAKRRHGLKTLLSHLEKDPQLVHHKSSLLPNFKDSLMILHLPIDQMTGKAGQ